MRADSGPESSPGAYTRAWGAYRRSGLDDISSLVHQFSAPGSRVVSSTAISALLPISLPSVPLFLVSSGSSGIFLPVTSDSVTTRPSTVPLGSMSTGDGKQPRPLYSVVPIPGKLVARIQALEYVDMQELLPDNLALAERLAALPQGLAPPKPPGEREIAGDRALLTWVSTFATYMAIVAEAHPTRVGDMLVYMRLLIREAGKFGGNGWLTYDAVFRRNNAGLSAPWNYIDASLHQFYIAIQQGKVAAPCTHCYEIDHMSTDYAVAAVLPK